MDAIIEWILLFLAAEAVLSLAQYALRDKIKKPAARVAVIIAKAFTAVLFAFLVLGGPVFLRPIQIPLVALYAALLPDAAADALGSLWYLIRRGKRAFLPV